MGKFSWRLPAVVGVLVFLLMQGTVVRTFAAGAGHSWMPAQTTIPPSSPPPPPAKSSAADAVHTLLAAINDDRRLHGAPPLQLDRVESRCSRNHSVHMATIGVISHDQFPADVCIPHFLSGENVGHSTGAARHTILELHHMMMGEGPCPRHTCGSTAMILAHGHYVNLVNPQFRRVGIGLYRQNGATWLTEDFVG